MKIDLNKINRNEFIVKEVQIAGEICYLVTPQHIDCFWNKDNLIFRSSIWNNNGELISAGFKKFFNYHEKPDLEIQPTDLKGCTSVEKLDGSLLIVSKYKGEMIYRTRGTSKATDMENGYEIPLLIEKYKNFFNSNIWYQETVNNNYLFEWTTPTNKIVIDYGSEPDIRLVGIIRNDDYSYFTQKELNTIAEYHGLKRPQIFQYSNITDLTSDVENFTDKEGICLYFNKDQSIRKVKSLWYLKLHAFKSQVSLENLIDVYLSISFLGYLPEFASYQKTCQFIESQFDFECLQMSIPFISKIADASKEVSAIMIGIQSFVSKLEGTRKDKALKIISSYGNTNRSGIAFALLDGKTIKKDSIKKLFYQILKGEF